jgi:hypothetical protein
MLDGCRGVKRRLDNKQPEDERIFKDSSRRYCELRNEAVRLGYRVGNIVPLDDIPASAGRS